MSMEAVMERRRRETMRMKRLLRADQAALRQKAEEREMLKRRKQSVLAEKAAKEKMVADFMLLTKTIEKNDTETAKKFDEKTMKNTILCMMEGGWGQNEGFAYDNGGGKEA